MKPCFSRVPLVCLVNCAVHSISYCYIHECNLKPVSFQIVLPLCPLFLYLQFHLFLFDTSFRFPSFLFSFSWIFVARGSSSGDYTTWTLWSCLRSRPSLGHFGEGKNVSSPVLNLTLPIRLLCLERPLPGGWSAVSSCKRKKNTSQSSWNSFVSLCSTTQRCMMKPLRSFPSCNPLAEIRCKMLAGWSRLTSRLVQFCRHLETAWTWRTMRRRDVHNSEQVLV